MSELGRRTGFVKTYKHDKGFGFIECDDDQHDVFVHIEYTVGEGYRRLETGQRVSFFVVQSDRGPQARQVMLIDEDGKTHPVPTATALSTRPARGAQESMPRPTLASLTNTALSNRAEAVQKQREAYLKDLANRAPTWVAAAREEQEHERQRAAAPAAPEPTPAPPEGDHEEDEPLRQGQRAYILAALDQIQQLAKRAERPGALIQIRRLAANVELIIEAPDSAVARAFGDENALNFDW